MRLLIDSSVLIDHLRGVDEATAVLETAISGRHEIWSITPVRTEVLGGLLPGEEPATLALLGLLEWQDVTIPLADLAGSYRRRFGRSHGGIDLVDYLLAAAADLLSADLLTCNVRHFPMFPDLEPAYR
jgi:hypothetical protein